VTILKPKRFYSAMIDENILWAACIFGALMLFLLALIPT
jgi:hypothetical protein